MYRKEPLILSEVKGFSFHHALCFSHIQGEGVQWVNRKLKILIASNLALINLIHTNIIIGLHVGMLCCRYYSEIQECKIEEYSAKRWLSPQIMKIELVSISATEASFLHSVKVS